jgi:signal transduction histidine kinase
VADREAWTRRGEGADGCQIMITVLVCAVLLAEVAVVCWALATLLSATREALAARELMSHLAHELRGPLDAIMMRAANLRGCNLSTDTRRDVESIEQIAANLSALVSSVLDAGALRAGRFSVSQKPCAPELLLRDVTELATAAATKRIRLETDVMHPQTNVLADRKRIVQVPSNMLDTR